MLFPKREYPCQCHVCGKVFNIVAEFLSSGQIMGEDGVMRSMHSCGQHSPDEVRAAWLKVGSPGAGHGNAFTSFTS